MKIKTLMKTPFGMIPFEEEIDQDPPIEFDFPLIPIHLFWQIASWQVDIALEHKCETTASLFLIDNEWIAMPFFQENTKGSMTADIDYETEENAALLAAFCDRSKMHGSIHNHVMGMAGQSGTDHADEENLPGPHITIGKLDCAKLDWAARFSVINPKTKKHEFIKLQPEDIVDLTPLTRFHEDPPTELMKTARDYVMMIPQNYPYPDEWKDRFKLKTSYYAPGVQYQKKTTESRGTPNTSGETRDARLWREARNLMRDRLSVKTLARFKKSIAKSLDADDEVLTVAVAQGVARYETIANLLQKIR